MASFNLFIVVLSIPLLLFTLFGNFFVVTVIISKCKKLRSVNTCLISHLAWSDLFFALTTFMEVILVYYNIPYSSFQFVANALVSSYFLAALAVERYYAILKPFVHMKRANKSLSRKVIIAVWIVVGILSAPGFIIESMMNSYAAYRQGNNVTVNTTTDTLDLLETMNTVYIFVLLACGLILPGAVMIFCYSRVIYHVWFNAEENKTTNAALFKSRRKLTKLFIIVTITFIVTWTPTFGRPIVKQFANKESTNNYQLVSMFLALIGSAANPVIYSFRCPRFRQEAVKMLSCCGCKRKGRRVNGRNGNRVFVVSDHSKTEVQHSTTRRTCEES